MIQVLKASFETCSTGLTLFPYKVIPLRVGKEKAPGGIIECVPNVKSRDEVRVCLPCPCAFAAARGVVVLTRSCLRAPSISGREARFPDSV